MPKCRFLLAGVLLLAVGCSSDPTQPRPTPEPKPKEPPPPPKTGLVVHAPSWTLAAAVPGYDAPRTALPSRSAARAPEPSA